MECKIVTLKNVPVSAQVVISRVDGPDEGDIDHEVIAIPVKDPIAAMKEPARPAQRFMGIAMIAISLFMSLLDGDATSLAILGPMGLWLALSKKNLLY